MRTHILELTIKAMVDDGELNAEEVVALRALVRRLQALPGDIQEELRSQPALVASAGYFYGKAKARAEQAKDDARYYEALRARGWKENPGQYELTFGAKAGRLTQKVVEALAVTSPDVQDLRRVRNRLNGYTLQLETLRDAYLQRGRLLEQMSNNERIALRLEE
jgi:hypothetical protein